MRIYAEAFHLAGVPRLAQKVEAGKDFEEITNAESVRQFQPRVAFWQPWEMDLTIEDATLKELPGCLINPKASQPLQGCEHSVGHFLDPGFPSNPGLTLANAFSVTRLFVRSLETPATRSGLRCAL